MKSQSVNYYLLESILTLMEGVDMMGRFDFSNFDPDDEADVSKLVVKIIKPSLDGTSLEKRAAIARSIAYYTTQGNVPFYDMAAERQELSMCDATSWPIFFDRIGLFAFGPDYKLQYLPKVVEERLDRAEAELIWAPTK